MHLTVAWGVNFDAGSTFSGVVFISIIQATMKLTLQSCVHSWSRWIQAPCGRWRSSPAFRGLWRRSATLRTRKPRSNTLTATKSAEKEPSGPEYIHPPLVDQLFGCKLYRNAICVFLQMLARLLHFKRNVKWMWIHEQGIRMDARC